jgi:L-alanine-DL-glutamate epimerase-like enolase superfamily enzyme
MNIQKTAIYKYSIPMVPFTIATGTMHFAQNIFIRVYTSGGLIGVGECSAFPIICGETQNTCFEMARDFAQIWKGKDATSIEERMNELHAYTAFNATIKSAFDMALYDLAAQKAHLPLYEYLGGKQKKILETDITVGIETPEQMAQKAVFFKEKGFRIIKIKVGKNPTDDVERIRQMRAAVGPDVQFRIDANQGWSFDDAVQALQQMETYNIQFCEQPMHHSNDHRLPELRKQSLIKIMADESVFNHYDAEQLIRTNACDYVNIKFAKSGGIHEAIKLNAVCEKNGIACMMGGMLESRLALTAFAHFATAFNNIHFYDMDTCMLGHTTDPVINGVQYNGYKVELPNTIGIGADVNEDFLKRLDNVII